MSINAGILPNFEMTPSNYSKKIKLYKINTLRGRIFRHKYTKFQGNCLSGLVYLPVNYLKKLSIKNFAKVHYDYWFYKSSPILCK